MKYDFNEVRSMLDQGVKVDDLCDAFANEVNRVTAEIEAEQRSEKRYKTMLSDITDEWNAIVDFKCDEHELASEVAKCLHVTPEVVDVLVSTIIGIMAVNGSLVPLIKSIFNEAEKTKNNQKIVAKPVVPNTFESIIADFLNDK